MKYFLISNKYFLGHLPQVNKINHFEYNGNEFWSTALTNIDMFVVHTYDFDAFILHLDTSEIDIVHQCRGLKHVVFKAPLCTKLLKDLKTDIDLYTKVYFIPQS